MLSGFNKNKLIWVSEYNCEVFSYQLSFGYSFCAIKLVSPESFVLVDEFKICGKNCGQQAEGGDCPPVL